MAEPSRELDLRDVRAMLAPGTPLREGIERIIRAGRGALIVIGWSAEVEPLVSGGFVIDIGATSQRVAELAKMDGALVLDSEASRILRANVHLVPDPGIPTSETGTRHRSAERTARQSGMPIIAVSESMGMVNLYYGDEKHVIEEVSALLFRANQALSTLERYRARLDEVSSTLSAREVEGTVTVRDAVLTLQRAEMLRRIAREVADHVSELGTEGRLIELQLDELVANVADERELVVRDYLADRRRKLSKVLADVAKLTTDQLLDPQHVASLLAYDEGELDRSAVPRGYRLLSRIPRLPAQVIDRLVESFGNLPAVMEASIDDLDDVDGVGESRARHIQEGLRRLAEVALLERFV
ncbi:MAG: DNA integrity scanning diadenylate cyclase DisA [Nitriliruptoraceae bacterium]|nr:DNA integrity scanning diadenylate cyclase DisA [Nitriliruptoraceae bacterium]